MSITISSLEQFNATLHVTRMMATESSVPKCGMLIPERGLGYIAGSVEFTDGHKAYIVNTDTQNTNPPIDMTLQDLSTYITQSTINDLILVDENAFNIVPNINPGIKDFYPVRETVCFKYQEEVDGSYYVQDGLTIAKAVWNDGTNDYFFPVWSQIPVVFFPTVVDGANTIEEAIDAVILNPLSIALRLADGPITVGARRIVKFNWPLSLLESGDKLANYDCFAKKNDFDAMSRVNFRVVAFEPELYFQTDATTTQKSGTVVMINDVHPVFFEAQGGLALDPKVGSVRVEPIASATEDNIVVFTVNSFEFGDATVPINANKYGICKQLPVDLSVSENLPAGFNVLRKNVLTNIVLKLSSNFATRRIHFKVDQVRSNIRWNPALPDTPKNLFYQYGAANMLLVDENGDRTCYGNAINITDETIAIHWSRMMAGINFVPVKLEGGFLVVDTGKIDLVTTSIDFITDISNMVGPYTWDHMITHLDMKHLPIPGALELAGELIADDGKFGLLPVTCNMRDGEVPAVTYHFSIAYEDSNGSFYAQPPEMADPSKVKDFYIESSCPVYHDRMNVSKYSVDIDNQQFFLSYSVQTGPNATSEYRCTISLDNTGTSIVRDLNINATSVTKTAKVAAADLFRILSHMAYSATISFPTYSKCIGYNRDLLAFVEIPNLISCARKAERDAIAIYSIVESDIAREQLFHAIYSGESSLLVNSSELQFANSVIKDAGDPSSGLSLVNAGVGIDPPTFTAVNRRAYVTDMNAILAIPAIMVSNLHVTAFTIPVTDFYDDADAPALAVYTAAAPGTVDTATDVPSHYIRYSDVWFRDIVDSDPDLEELQECLPNFCDAITVMGSAAPNEVTIAKASAYLHLPIVEFERSLTHPLPLVLASKLVLSPAPAEGAISRMVFNTNIQDNNLLLSSTDSALNQYYDPTILVGTATVVYLPNDDVAYLNIALCNRTQRHNIFFMHSTDVNSIIASDTFDPTNVGGFFRYASFMGFPSILAASSTLATEVALCGFDNATYEKSVVTYNAFVVANGGVPKIEFRSNRSAPAFGEAAAAAVWDPYLDDFREWQYQSAKPVGWAVYYPSHDTSFMISQTGEYSPLKNVIYNCLPPPLIIQTSFGGIINERFDVTRDGRLTSKNMELIRSLPAGCDAVLRGLISRIDNMKIDNVEGAITDFIDTQLSNVQIFHIVPSAYASGILIQPISVDTATGVYTEPGATEHLISWDLAHFELDPNTKMNNRTTTTDTRFNVTVAPGAILCAVHNARDYYNVYRGNDTLHQIDDADLASQFRVLRTFVRSADSNDGALVVDSEADVLRVAKNIKFVDDGSDPTAGFVPTGPGAALGNLGSRASFNIGRQRVSELEIPGNPLTNYMSTTFMFEGGNSAQAVYYVDDDGIDTERYRVRIKAAASRHQQARGASER